VTVTTIHNGPTGEVTMDSIAISLIVFVCVVGGALFGMFLLTALLKHHMSAESLDVVKMGMGMVATLSALVLGLLIASAKSSYDAKSTELTQVSAKIVLLDRVLAHYGPGTKEARELLRSSVARALDQTWSKHYARSSELEPPSAGGEVLFDKIQGLSPKDDTQGSLKARALSIAMGVANALVDVRTRNHLDIHANSQRAGFLAYNTFHQFRPLRPS